MHKQNETTANNSKQNQSHSTVLVNEKEKRLQDSTHLPHPLRSLLCKKYDKTYHIGKIMGGMVQDIASITEFSSENWWLLPAVNASLSAVCSILVMSIILRLSPESRTSPYHIIVFFVSFWDAAASTMMALNTTLMRSDVYEVYPSLAGKAFGSIGTCEVQGFVIYVGSLFILCSNLVLCVYYLCTFRYGIREEKMKKIVLPFLLAISIPTSLMIPVVALRAEFFNPSPIANICTAIPYPIDCDMREHGNSPENDDGSSITCIRGWKMGSWGQDTFHLFAVILLFFTFLFLVSTLVLVVATVFRAEVVIRRRRRAQQTEDSNIGPLSLEAEFKRTKAVLIQAVLYIGAFMFTWFPVLFVIVLNFKSVKMLVIAAFCRPLHGFLSALIFTYQKVHTLRQTRVELTYFKALKQIIMAPSTVPGQLISRIDIVDQDLEGRQQSESLILVEDASASERRRIARHHGGIRRLGTGVGLIGNSFTPPSSVDSQRDSSLVPSSASSLDGFLSDNGNDDGSESESDIECKTQQKQDTLTSNTP